VLSIWDERRLAKRLRIVVRELAQLNADVRKVGDALCAIDADGERADSQRERGEAWNEGHGSFRNGFSQLHQVARSL